MLVADRMPRVPGVGDIVSDVQGLFALYQTGGEPGGIGGYFTDLYRRFSALPGDVRDMNGQIDRVGKVLTAASADTTLLADARRDCNRLLLELPTAQRDVQQLWQILQPYLPQIQTGELTTQAISTLAIAGVDIVGTFNRVKDLFELQRNAQGKIERSVTNPQLSPSVQQQAVAALQGGAFSSPLVAAGLVAVFGYILLDVFKKPRYAR